MIINTFLFLSTPLLIWSKCKPGVYYSILIGLAPRWNLKVEKYDFLIFLRPLDKQNRNSITVSSLSGLSCCYDFWKRDLKIWACEFLKSFLNAYKNSHNNNFNPSCLRFIIWFTWTWLVTQGRTVSQGLDWLVLEHRERDVNILSP